MRPARALLTVAACVLAPGAAAAALTYIAIDWLADRCQRTHPTLDAAIASELGSWFPTPEVHP